MSPMNACAMAHAHIFKGIDWTKFVGMYLTQCIDVF